jgi:uncharacterized protein
MRVPTDEEIRALHERFAPSTKVFELVHTHCEIVCEIAEQLLARTPLRLDAELVRAGCLLHDIGVYRLYDARGVLDHARYVRHGILGHRLLSELGYAEVICRFCSCHTGVGISRDDVRRQRLPIPVADYVAVSDEEQLVMYADKFHSKASPPIFLTAASYAARVRRFGADKPAVFEALCEKFGPPDLAPLMERHGHPLV